MISITLMIELDDLTLKTISGEEKPRGVTPWVVH